MDLSEKLEKDSITVSNLSINAQGEELLGNFAQSAKLYAEAAEKWFKLAKEVQVELSEDKDFVPYWAAKFYISAASCWASIGWVEPASDLYKWLNTKKAERKLRDNLALFDDLKELRNFIKKKLRIRDEIDTPLKTIGLKHRQNVSSAEFMKEIESYFGKIQNEFLPKLPGLPNLYLVLYHVLQGKGLSKDTLSYLDTFVSLINSQYNIAELDAQIFNGIITEDKVFQHELILGFETLRLAYKLSLSQEHDSQKRKSFVKKSWDILLKIFHSSYEEELKYIFFIIAFIELEEKDKKKYIDISREALNQLDNKYSLPDCIIQFLTLLIENKITEAGMYKFYDAFVPMNNNKSKTKVAQDSEADLIEEVTAEFRNRIPVLAA